MPMKVNVFISLYNARVKHIDNINQDKIMEIIVDLIKPISYLPYDDKLKIVDYVIENTKNEKYPTAYRYRLFVVNLISAYTNLDCNIDDFDNLSSSKLIDIILHTFEQEYIICNHLLQMCIADFLGGDNYGIKYG